MRRCSAPALAAVILTLTLTLVWSSTAAAYLATLGPKSCCSSTCHRGKPTSDADANRCCRTHLGVLPSALGPTAPDVQHVVATLVTVVPVPFTVVVPRLVDLLAPTVMLRGSPPGTLVAAATQLLI